MRVGAGLLTLQVAKQLDAQLLLAESLRVFEERFADVPAPFFRPELIDYTGDEALPLMSYKVKVPELYGSNPAAQGHLMVKVEFHIEDDLPLPPSDELSAESGAVGETIKAKVPRVPYQVGLKLMTLVAPTVGIGAGREGSIPRQIYDLDSLFQQVGNAADWQALHEYAVKRHDKEVRQRHLSPRPGEPWSSIDERLGYWSNTDRKGSQRKLITGFLVGSRAITRQVLETDLGQLRSASAARKLIGRPVSGAPARQRP